MHIGIEQKTNRESKSGTYNGDKTNRSCSEINQDERVGRNENNTSGRTQEEACSMTMRVELIGKK